ncbi:MAG: cysteine desulfurase [Myxococcota bacterium]
MDRMDMVGALRSRLAAGLVELGGLVLGSEGLPNTLNIRFDGVDGETMLMALDMAGVALSSGSACTAGSLEPSHVLLAMGLTQDQARGAVRFSLGVGTTAVQIERTTAIVADALPRLRAVA